MNPSNVNYGSCLGSAVSSFSVCLCVTTGRPPASHIGESSLAEIQLETESVTAVSWPGIPLHGGQDAADFLHRPLQLHLALVSQNKGMGRWLMQWFSAAGAETHLDIKVSRDKMKGWFDRQRCTGHIVAHITAWQSHGTSTSGPKQPDNSLNLPRCGSMFVQHGPRTHAYVRLEDLFCCHV